MKMFDKKQPCSRCKSSLKTSFDFCPYCGQDVRNSESQLEEYGLLGKNEFNDIAPLVGGGSLGFTDKLFQSIFNQLMKSLDAQMRGAAEAQDARPEITQLPNGIQIKIGLPQQKQQRQSKRKTITEEQIKRMSGLPRAEAKTDVRRLSDKVLYELKTPDVMSVDDVFVSKVESGYEVKAIGAKKVYVNSLQVDLPLRSYTLHEKGVTFEFALH